MKTFGFAVAATVVVLTSLVKVKIIKETATLEGGISLDKNHHYLGMCVPTDEPETAK